MPRYVYRSVALTVDESGIFGLSDRETDKPDVGSGGFGAELEREK